MSLPPRPPVNREVVESDRYTREASKIEPDAQRFDELVNGLIWAISVHPESHEQIGDTEIWAIASEPWPGVPECVIYYSFNETTVTLESIRLARDVEDE